MLRHGWRTAAIVPELEQETNVVSTNRYSLNLTWLQALTGLMERLQVGWWSSLWPSLLDKFLLISSVLFQTLQDSESKMIFHEWQKEREELRWADLTDNDLKMLPLLSVFQQMGMLAFEMVTCDCRRVMMKNLFNPQFGSIFRTCHNPTYFSRRLCRFSDIYMTSVSCLLNYDLTYTFYPRRTPLQHEAPLWMDQLCTGCLKIPHLEEMSHIRWELCPLSVTW